MTTPSVVVDALDLADADALFHRFDHTKFSAFGFASKGPIQVPSGFPNSNTAGLGSAGLGGSGFPKQVIPIPILAYRKNDVQGHTQPPENENFM